MPRVKPEPFVPDPEDVKAWHDYLNRPRPPRKRKISRARTSRPGGRARPLKRGRKKIYRDFNRDPPSLRGFFAIMVRRDVYEMLREMRTFYKLPYNTILCELVRVAYEKTYKQAELLARISNRGNDGAVQDKP